MNKERFLLVLCGLCAGAVNGLFGAGGGMVLVSMLTAWTATKESDIFPTSLSLMLPICVVSLLLISIYDPIPWQKAFPYLIGSGIGGLLAGILGPRISVKWLHKLLGVFILWGGIRYLC